MQETTNAARMTEKTSNSTGTDIEEEMKKATSKIIEITKNDIRTLEQKVTDTINNNTNLETRMKKLQETQNKTMADKKDLVNITTTNQTSQRQMGEAITPLSEGLQHFYLTQPDNQML